MNLFHKCFHFILYPQLHRKKYRFPVNLDFLPILSIGNCTLSCHLNAFTHKCFHHTLTLAPPLKKYRFLVNLVFLPILIMGNCTLSCHSIAFTLMLSHVFYTQWFPHPTSYSFIHELLIGFLFRYIYLLHNITFMTLHLSMSLTSCYSINFILFTIYALSHSQPSRM